MSHPAFIDRLPHTTYVLLLFMMPEWMPKMAGRNAIIAKGVGIAFLCVASGVVGAAMSRHLGESTYRLSYVDFISIMLSAISVLMTTLAIFLAVLGVIGWNSIQTRVQDRTKSFLDEEFQEGKSLRVMMETKIDQYMYQGIMPQVPDINEQEGEQIAGQGRP